MSSDTLEAMRGEFLEHLRTRGSSAYTLKTYGNELRRFIAWCAERELTRVTEITRPIVTAYQRHLVHYRKADGAPLAFKTQAGRLSALRGLFRWLARHNHILYNPTADLELPKIERRLPRNALSIQEVEKVLQQANTTRSTGLRDRAIMETLYSTGLRRAELVGLAVHDLDMDGATVHVRQGKGARDRIVPIGERALAWNRRYLFEVRPDFLGPRTCSSLYLTILGGPFVPAALSQRMRAYVEASGIGKPGSCHIFRHTMATLMLENGADIRYIQAMLGHARLDTTQIYTHVSIGALQQVHADTHPSARLSRHRRR